MVQIRELIYRPRKTRKAPKSRKTLKPRKSHTPVGSVMINGEGYWKKITKRSAEAFFKRR